MGEKIRVLGVDPSLRNTGLAIVTYDTEKQSFDTPCECHVIINPAKYKGKDAILSMLDLIQELSEDYLSKSEVTLVESPPIMFNQSWSGGTISLISHVAGGAAALLGLSRVHLFRPNEWNRTRKKEVTHAKTEAVLGSADDWHFRKPIKNEKSMEHILDAASMALWWIQTNYIDEVSS